MVDKIQDLQPASQSVDCEFCHQIAFFVNLCYNAAD